MADYDSASLYIDTQTVLDCYNSLKSQTQDMVDDLTSINNQLSALALTWAGQTAQDVQQINDSWTNSMKSLFGTQDDPQSGCLNVILAGLFAIGGGYSVVEDQLQQTWKQFYDQLVAASSSTSSDTSTHPQTPLGVPTTAVQEFFPG
jgi:uncharacterized protein YukE